MFAITKLCQDSQVFVTELSTMSIGRSNVSALALAKVLTNCVNLPSSALANTADVLEFYNTHVRLDIEKKVSAINEIVLLNVPVVLDFCQKFYTQRYYAAHPPCNVMSFRKATAVEDFFGVSRSFDEVTLEIVKSEPSTLTYRCNKFNTLVNDLFKPEPASTTEQA